jgi:cytochrome c oxidase subunit II
MRRRGIQGILAGGLLLLLTACGPHVQSVLDPRSAEAREIARLWWVMFGICGAVFVLVVWLLFQAVFGREGARVPGGPTRFVVALGIVLPAVVLVYFLLHSLRVSVVTTRGDERLTIDVVGHQWWWDVRYPDHGIVIANEIHLPAHQRVRVRLKAHDVIHSFWVPNLHGKVDMMPDVDTAIWLEADEPGVWRGQCAEFCGTQHALMAFDVVVHEPEAFEQWIEERQQALAKRRTVDAVHPGEALFFRHGCYSCHSIAGLERGSEVGPDLTHFGDRRTLGAAAIENNRGNLAGWISNPQSIKPGNRMPPTYLEAEELHTLVDYLLSLD